MIQSVFCACFVSFFFVQISNEYAGIMLIYYARYKSIDPESALQKVNNKFKPQLEYIETLSDKQVGEMSLEEIDALWNGGQKYQTKITI